MTAPTQPTKVANNAAGIRGIGPQADAFTLSGETSPGKATLVACNAAQEWDIRKGYGLSWATAVPAGEQLSKVDFEIELWTAADSKAWDAFAAKYLSRPAPAQPGTTTTKSLGFNHDQASAPPYNVAAVIVLEVTYLGQREAGIIAHRVSFLEWKQPLPAPVRPNQNTPPVEGALPSAKDKADQELLDAVADMKSAQLADTSSIPGHGGQ